MRRATWVHGSVGFLLASCESSVQAETQPSSRGPGTVGQSSAAVISIAHSCDSVQAFLGSWVELASTGVAGGLVAIGIKVNSGLGCPPACPGASRIFRNENR